MSKWIAITIMDGIISNVLLLLIISNISEHFMQAGIHRLRATIHLIQMIDDTLTYLKPRCAVSLPWMQGKPLLSSQLLKFLQGKQHPNAKLKQTRYVIGDPNTDSSKAKVSSKH